MEERQVNTLELHLKMAKERAKRQNEIERRKELREQSRRAKETVDFWLRR